MRQQTKQKIKSKAEESSYTSTQIALLAYLWTLQDNPLVLKDPYDVALTSKFIEAPTVMFSSSMARFPRGATAIAWAAPPWGGPPHNDASTAPDAPVDVHPMYK